MRFLTRFPLIALTLAIVSASTLALAAEEGRFERTLNATGRVSLQIETGSGSINVRQGSANEVRVTGHIRQNNWGLFASHASPEEIKRLEDNPPIQQSGNDIRIGHIDDPELRRNVSISYEVVAPADTQLHSSTGSGSQQISGLSGTVEAEAGSGSLKLSDIGSGVRAHTGSGSIDIDNVKGSVFAHAGSGSIHATNVAGGFDGDTGSGHLWLEQTAPGSVRAETGSGGLELRNVHGSLQAHAGSGSIKAEGEATGEWVVRTGSGSVQLQLPQSASFDLNARTGSGVINLNHAVTVQGSIGRKEVRGKVGSGGVPVDVQTGSGNIAID
jgi:putative adhesin